MAVGMEARLTVIDRSLMRTRKLDDIVARIQLLIRCAALKAVEGEC